MQSHPLKVSVASLWLLIRADMSRMVKDMDDSSETMLSHAFRMRLPDPRDKNSAAADRLLDAAFCLMVERGAKILARGLSASDLTKRSGQSRQTFYTEFDGDMVALLVESLVQGSGLAEHHRSEVNGIDQITEGIEQQIVGGSDLPPRDVVRMLAVANFEMATDDPSFIAHLLLGALAPSSDSAASGLYAGYRSMTASYVEAFDALLIAWKRGIRAPFTVESVAVALTALTEGLALRRIVDPDVDTVLFADLVDVITSYVLVPVGEMDARQKDIIDGFPSDGRSHKGATNAHSRIIDATIRQFSLAGSGDPTVSEIAELARVSEGTLRQHFGGVAGVVVAAWSEWILEFRDEIERDQAVDPPRSGMDVVERHLIRVGTKALEHPALSGALVRVMQTSVERSAQLPTDAREQVPFPAILADLLLRAHEQHEINLPSTALHADSPPERAALLARTATNLLFVMVVTNPCPPNRSVNKHANWCVRYLLDMMSLST